MASFAEGKHTTTPLQKLLLVLSVAGIAWLVATNRGDQEDDLGQRDSESQTVSVTTYQADPADRPVPLQPPKRIYAGYRGEETEQVANTDTAVSGADESASSGNGFLDQKEVGGPNEGEAEVKNRGRVNTSTRHVSATLPAFTVVDNVNAINKLSASLLQELEADDAEPATAVEKPLPENASEKDTEEPALGKAAVSADPPGVSESFSEQDEVTQGWLVIENPKAIGYVVSFLYGDEHIELRAGQSFRRSGSEFALIQFNRGGDFGNAEIRLEAGRYAFDVDRNGWAIVPVPDEK